MNLYSGQQWRNRQREQTYGHGEGRRGKKTRQKIKKFPQNA